MARNRSIASLGCLLALSACATPDFAKDYTLFDLFLPRKTTLPPPANLPPAGYQGEYWIDTDGCIYIRTDADEWLPQVNIDRKPICDPDNAGEAVDNSAAQPSVDPTPRVFIDPETGVMTEVLAEVTIPESYVQIGTFSNKANAAAASRKFAELGFPLAEYRRQSGALTVLVGPFTVQSALDDALSVAGELGYTDAFTFEQ